MKLIIVESPTKAKTISTFLKGAYKVVASKGHVRDLPKSKIGVDTTNDFEVTYTIPEKAQSNVSVLLKEYKQSDELFLATDEDREGEAISYHIAHILDAKKVNTFKRIVFHEITKTAIEHALANPRKVDMNLVDAQQARRVLDRLVGYNLSPLLWKKIQFGLSAGRVQSVALRLIVEKERERMAFIVQNYFEFKANFKNKKGDYLGELTEINNEKMVQKLKKDEGFKFLVTSPEASDNLLKDIQLQKYKILEVTKKDTTRNPYPPFTTSLLQQTVGNLAGFSASRTMKAAQQLYEKGFITYHRTDSFNISEKFASEAQKFIEKNFGQNEFIHRRFKNKSKNAQEAHEAIRVTNLNNLPASMPLDHDSQIVYELIFSRSLACFMQPARGLSTKIKTSSLDEKYVFKTEGTQILYKGYLRAFEYAKSIKYNFLSDTQIVPDLSKDELVTMYNLSSEEKFTKPVAPFTESSLIKALEKYGIGRPSTYAPTISTLLARKYIEKNGKQLIPTDLGFVVIKFLEDNFKNIIDYNFTAKIEADLDTIALGNMEWKKVLRDFYSPFKLDLEKTQQTVERKDYKDLGEAPLDIVCPICSSNMVIKLGRSGRFYSCATFPMCKGLRSIDGESEEDVKLKTQTPEFKKEYKVCPKTKDGRDFLLKKGRYGLFWAHPDYPKVKEALPLELKKEALEKLYGKIPKTKEGKDFVLKRGRFGMFFAHPDYPKVKEIIKIKKTST